MRLGYCLMCGKLRQLDKGVCLTCEADERERMRRRDAMLGRTRVRNDGQRERKAR